MTLKVHFDNVILGSRSGPNSFATRLAKGLFERGIEVLSDATGADVSLVFIEPTGKPLANKVVQRLDGIWFKPEEFLHKNTNIKRLYETVDCVIWQSEFDKKMTTHHWQEPKKGVVIRNGCDVPLLPDFSPMLMLRQQYQTIFVCSANWHPQKRLKSNVEMFFHLRQKYPNSCLIVMGNNPDYVVASPHVYYTGSLTHDRCAEVFQIADWMIHLAWLDHCPNVVVEALCQNVPVICSSAGGTHELVQDFGIIIHEKVPYEYQLTNYDEPPEIDVKQVCELPDVKTLGKHANVDINDVVTLYIEVLQGL